MAAALQGFALGIGLILAIGAQNAFVLRQGLAGRHVGAVVAVCVLSDWALIAAGVAGVGALVRAAPALEGAMRLAGAAFLAWYGVSALRAAWRGGDVLQAAGGAGSLRATLVTCLALTWLNPHVYLDTLVLVGAVAAQSQAPWAFGAGAAAASAVFFCALGYGARSLAPVFARPGAWRVLDAAVGLTMLGLAALLIAGA